MQKHNSYVNKLVNTLVATAAQRGVVVTCFLGVRRWSCNLNVVLVALGIGNRKKEMI